MAAVENASLVLKTAVCDTKTAPTNLNLYTKGTQQPTSYNWNVNLRNLLGTMYDKYDKFRLTLNSVSTGNYKSTLSTTVNITLGSIGTAITATINGNAGTATTPSTTLTITAYTGTSALAIGTVVSWNSNANMAKISALGTGTGGLGTYTLDTAVYIPTSTPLSCGTPNNTLTVNATNGVLGVGTVIIVWGQQATITALGTGTGGTGTYTLSGSTYISVSTATTPITGFNIIPVSTSADDCLLTANLSGLPFLNNTYNSKTQNNGSTALCGVIQYTPNNSSFIQYATPIPLTFGKNQDVCNISITLNRVVDGNDPFYQQTAAVQIYPDSVFSFTIYGISNDVGNLNATRLIL